MKQDSHSLPQFGFLPRVKNLPLSSFGPRLTIAAFLVAFSFAAAVPAQMSVTDLVAATYTSAENMADTNHALERRVFDLVNNERVKNGRQPLAWIEPAAEAARSHSQNMADHNFFNHTGPSGQRFDSRAGQFGIGDWRQLGENIAWISGGGDPAARVVASWMGSAGHRENILNSKYRETGIGLALSSDGKYYFTQLFVLR